MLAALLVSHLIQRKSHRNVNRLRSIADQSLSSSDRLPSMRRSPRVREHHSVKRIRQGSTLMRFSFADLGRNEPVRVAVTLNHALAGPHQMESDQRNALGRQQVQQALARLDCLVAIEIAADRPLGLGK